MAFNAVPLLAHTLFLSLFWVSQAPAFELNVNITGLKSNLGDVHIALYNSPENFPDEDGIFQEQEVLIKKRRAIATFRDLKPGPYAVAVYHDENNNDAFDQGFLGLPLEDYGFSNGARVFFAPPSFEAAQINVPPGGRLERIDLGNAPDDP